MSVIILFILPFFVILSSLILFSVFFCFVIQECFMPLHHFRFLLSLLYFIRDVSFSLLLSSSFFPSYISLSISVSSQLSISLHLLSKYVLVRSHRWNQSSQCREGCISHIKALLSTNSEVIEPIETVLSQGLRKVEIDFRYMWSRVC